MLLREDAEPPEIARRFTLLREMLGPHAGGVSEVWARGRGRLARLLSLAALGQWVSYYVAMLQGTDPVAGADAHRGEAPAGDAIGRARPAPLRVRATPC